MAEVGKTPEIVKETNSVDQIYEQDDDESAKQMDGFTLIRDQVDGNSYTYVHTFFEDLFFNNYYSLAAYTTVLLNTTISNTQEELCHESDDYKQCCWFNITTSISSDSLSDYYRYRLVAYGGVRSYSGMYNGGVDICGIIACTDTTLASCADRYNSFRDVSPENKQ